jgi:endonuclease YncB( thermonuclease family)
MFAISYNNVVKVARLALRTEYHVENALSALEKRSRQSPRHRPPVRHIASTIEIPGQRARLFGIDAPESSQPCVCQRALALRAAIQVCAGGSAWVCHIVAVEPKTWTAGWLQAGGPLPIDDIR